MYLKALEIQGFKSFPDKTRLTFEKEITAIVGPNGSGKSNISDAMLWVMGEQRSRALRGGKMEDVIFGGTEKRSPLGFAQVSLVLDNSAGLFDVDAPELVITRRYYRNGESEYYINREAVRLRDVTELLMDTGLGRDGYSVIGQGRIAEIVSAKSTDRREVFEEAAGIARYRRRKEEAERKLAGTQDNLLRINDKIDELELQVTPLKQQAETAKKYLVLRDEQRTLEISVWMETLDRLHEQAEQVNADYENAKKSLDDAQLALEGLYAESGALSEKMRECDLRAEAARTRRAELQAEAAECDSAAAVLRTEMRHNEETAQRLDTELSEQAGRAESLRSQIESHAARLGEIAEARRQLEISIGESLSRARENAERSDSAKQDLAALAARESAVSAELTQSRTISEMLEGRLSELSTRGGDIDAELSDGETKREKAAQELIAAKKELSRAKERFDEVGNVISGHRMLMGGREERVKKLTDELNAITVEKRSAQGREKMLSDMQREYEGLGRAVKTVMREAARGTLRGVHGPVAGLISVDKRYAAAIETALGAAMQNIVVDTQENGKAAIELLKRSDSGRATFLPINTIRPGSLRRVPQGDEGYIGVASDIVRFDRRYENIILNLLGRTVVAETLGDAVRMSKRYDNQLRIVTLDGQLINAGGSMTGGSASKNTGILSRAAELEGLKTRLAQLEKSEGEASARLSSAERELSAARYELSVAEGELDGAAKSYHDCQSRVGQLELLVKAADEALDGLDREKAGLSSRIAECRRRIDDAREKTRGLEEALSAVRAEAEAQALEGGELERRRDELSQELTALRERMASLDAERETTLRSREGLEQLLEAMSGDDEQRRSNIDELRAQAQRLESELGERLAQLEEKNRAAAEQTQRIDEQTQKKLELEGKRETCDRAAQDKNRELLDMQSVCARFEQKKLSSEMEETQIVDKLWESYELSRTAAQQLRRPVESMPQSTKRIGEIKREIGRLGAVNVGAIDEYARVSERYEFLTGQRDDVAGAKRELEKIISDLTGEMRGVFTQKFREIDASFREVFLELFGGGRASLELEDEENVLECGIEIKVQPPGKAVTTISLLSGGEKSFVAIALYFAIMKVRPTPFCIMDEIDAALDEANVIRYAEYMRRMADKTQFIAITHHRGTMEEADMLYGVTMQEKGVSTVLSIDLEEAEKTAE